MSTAPRHRWSSTAATASPAGRALVLGGGGSTGNAWLVGVVAGLAEAGLDVTTADLTVGTSAGSTAAAQLVGHAPVDLLTAVLEPRSSPPGAPHAGVRNPGRPVPDQLDRLRRVIASSTDAADMRRRLGVVAHELAAASDGAWSTRWRATVATRLPGVTWPQRRLLITAIDAVSGAPVVFDRDSGIDLVDAVAASCSNALPYAVGDRSYLDGGYRRNENADLAAGHHRVLVLSPFGGRSLHPPQLGMQLAAQIDELRAAGNTVEVLSPDAEIQHLFGANAMKLSLRPAAARAGRVQGRMTGPALAAFWR